MKKYIWIVLLIVVASTIIIVFSFKKSKEQKILDVETIQKYVIEQENDRDFDYFKFIEIEMEKSQVLFNKTTVEQTEDDDLANIVYNLKIRNVTQSNIRVHYTLYIPKEFAEKFVVGERVFNLFVDDVDIKSNKNLNIGHGTLIRHYDLLSQEEKNIFNKYKDTVYLALSINGKTTYLEVNPNKVK